MFCLILNNLETEDLKNIRIPNFFMRILKAFDKEVNNKKYFRYRINLPKKIIEESGLLEKKLKVVLEKGKIIIEKIS